MRYVLLCVYNPNAIFVRTNCLFVVETWERIKQLFGHSKQNTHNAAKIMVIQKKPKQIKSIRTEETIIKLDKQPSLVKFTISLKQNRLLRWCFEIPKTSVSQDKKGVEWSTKALYRHSDELVMCLLYHRQNDKMKENSRLDDIKERLDLLKCQTS